MLPLPTGPLSQVTDPVLAAMQLQYNNAQAGHGLAALASSATPGLALAGLMAQNPTLSQAVARSPISADLTPLVGVAAMMETDPLIKKQRLAAEKAAKEAADKAEGERRKCHLHAKPKKNCKKCQSYQEWQDKGKEDKAALKDKFVAHLRGQSSSSGSMDAEITELHKPMEIVNTETFGFPPLLQSHIIESQHFRTVMVMEKFDQIVDELYAYTDGVEPYKTLGAGQQSIQAPSALFVCVLRLFVLGIDGRQLRQLLDSTDNPYVRCAGILFVRYGLAPDQLWPWLGEYTLDDEEFPAGKDYEWGKTIGDYVEMILREDYYYKTVLPRLPSSTKKALDMKLAQVPQYRKRAQANQQIIDFLRQGLVRVEACPNDVDWQAGKVVGLIEKSSGRTRVKIRWDTPGPDQRPEQEVLIGKVILADNEGADAARASGAIDWTRDKGRSSCELLDDMHNRKKEQAVASGKDYAKRPVSFQVALPFEQGNASANLAREETHVERSKRRDRSRSRSQERKKEPSAEHQARMKALFEKYGMQKSGQDSRKGTDDGMDKPDLLRLG